MHTRSSRGKHAVLQLLLSGPKSASEIGEALGVSTNAARLAIDRLRRDGHHITSSGCAPRAQGGGKGSAEGVYRLAAPGGRSCAWPGCSEHLNRYNRGLHCLYHRRLAAVLYLARLDRAAGDCEVWP